LWLFLLTTKDSRFNNENISKMEKSKNTINENKEKILKPKGIKDLAKGVLYYNSASILGPLILFIGLGVLLDNKLETKPYLTIAGLIIAFITTNILIFRKVKKLTIELKNIPNKKNREEINN